MMSSTKNNIDLDEKINLAVENKNRGKYSDALRAVEKLIGDYPEKGSLYGIAGSILFETEKFEKAAGYFKKATVISPKSELASLGLFHSLWQLGKNEDAFEEMKRFMSIGESLEYNELLKYFLGEKENG